MRLPNNPLQKGLNEPRKAADYIYRHAILGPIDRLLVTPLRGRYLFQEDWDLAIILDACRYDLALTLDHDLPPPERVYSVGFDSQSWLKRTFADADEETLRRTAYVTGKWDSADFDWTSLLAVYDDVWRYCWDEEQEVVPPRPVTDQTIRLSREDAADRYLAHYMQPHLPPLVGGAGFDAGIDPSADKWRGGNPWQRVERGELDGSRVERAYQGNLNAVMDDVALLLENVDAERVVITSDHGNYLGEHGRWGHYHWSGMGDGVRMVPWWETTASDERTHEPDRYSRD